jgi:hypothetical protein
LEIYFRYKVSRLMKVLGYENYFLEYMAERKDMKLKYNKYVKSKPVGQSMEKMWEKL